MKNIKKYMLIAFMVLFAGSLLACSKKEENAITNSKVSFSYKIENKEEGKLRLEISLAQNSPMVAYKVLENEKEISAGEIAEGDTRIIDIITIQSVGNKYEYKLIINDKQGNEVIKDLEVNLFEGVKEEASKEEVDKEPEWNGKAKEYKIGEKVSFDKKVFECIQQHTSQADWTPLAAPSLWREVK